jgi:hypothetical protein
MQNNRLLYSSVLLQILLLYMTYDSTYLFLLTMSVLCPLMTVLTWKISRLEMSTQEIIGILNNELTVLYLTVRPQIERTIGVVPKDTAHKFGSNCLRVEYIYQGTKYSLLVPFRLSLVPSHLNKQVTTIVDNKKTPINNQPGVPHLVTPKDIGSAVSVLDLNTKEVIEYTDRDKYLSIDT